jgi:DNA primase
VEVKGYSVKVVEQAGLVIERKSGSSYYDRFRDRLMIPICDVQGRVVGFGGRALGDAQPKYLNSPETPIFDKGNLLFGLDRAKKGISKQDRAIVVEGYFDAIALHAAGISEVVASLGTALSVSQVKKLVRYTPSKSIILNFDADQAGTTATERAISEIADLVYQGQIQLRVLNLPQGKDADEFLKSAGSPQPYLELVEQAPLWLDWQIEQTLKGKDLRAADGFQQVAQTWVKVLSKVEDPTMRNYYINLCAEHLSQGNGDRLKFIAEDLAKQIQRLRRTPKTQHNPKVPKIEVKITPEDRLLLETESLILRIYLHAAEAREYFLQIMGDRHLTFQCAPNRFLWSQIESLRETLPIDSVKLVSKLQDEVGHFPNYSDQFHPLLYLQEKHLSDIQKPILSIEKAALTLEQILCRKRRRYAAERLAKIDPKLDLKGYKYFSQQLIENKQREQELERLRSATVSELVSSS